MRIGILIDRGRLAHWQARALREIASGNEFVIYECTNSRSNRRVLAHAFYYLLNLVTVRNHQTAGTPLPKELRTVERVSFAAEADGKWQAFPASLLGTIDRYQPAVILKFGMGMVRIPSVEQLACPILSYHHGDPSEFRGRPAGFYELLAGKPTLGQVVQVLTNRLDAGRIVGFAETKVHPHSYRKTLVEAFRCSPLILKRAIDNALADRDLPIGRDGKNHRLPSNLTVANFVARLLKAKISRLGYGAFIEKAWRVAEAPLADEWSPRTPQSLCDERQWSPLRQPRCYGFLADPFYDPGGHGILAEAMRHDGRGVIVRIDGSDVEQLPIDGGHCSFPASVVEGGRSFIVPETGGWSAPRLFELQAAGVEDRGALRLPGNPRILDPILFRHEDAVFLFGNLTSDGDGVLRLWSASSLADAFAEHPDSPVRISPAGGRMGGLIMTHKGGLHRVGQDFRRGYGDGLLLFPIEELSRHRYRESEPSALRFRDRRGPHTLNLRQSRALFDYYNDRFSLFASLRRLKQRRAGR